MSISQPTPDMRELMIKEDLGWLDQLQVHEIDGKLMLGEEGSDLPMNISHLMNEEEFVRKWLLAFALGNHLGINYFPSAEWFKLTFNGTRAVLVVRKDKEGKVTPVLLIQPLITHSLTEEDRDLLRRAAEVIYINNHDEMKKNNVNANLEVAQVLANPEVGLKAKPTTYTDLIPMEYFREKGINPLVEQQIYYIRDVVRKGVKTAIADIERARVILYAVAEGKKVPAADLLFVHNLSLGEYEINDVPTEDGSNAAQNTTVSGSDDPLEC